MKLKRGCKMDDKEWKTAGTPADYLADEFMALAGCFVLYEHDVAAQPERQSDSLKK